MWARILVPLVLAISGYLGHQVRVLHGRISKRDDRIEQFRRDGDTRIAAIDDKVDSAILRTSDRLTRLETLAEGMTKKLDKLNGPR